MNTIKYLICAYTALCLAVSSCASINIDDVTGIELKDVAVQVDYTSARVSGYFKDISKIDMITDIQIKYGISYDSINQVVSAKYDGPNGFSADIRSLEDGCQYFYRVDIIVGKTTLVGEILNFVTFPIGPIDLDLPSGKRWASHNVGAENPTASGEYYAWGEIEEKNNYNWKTYKFCVDGSFSKLTKYVTEEHRSYFGSPDNMVELLPEDDVAYMRLGEGWSIPTYKDWMELIDNSLISSVTINGIKGVKISSLSDRHNFKKFIFLPSQGGLYKDTSLNYDTYAYYWTSTLSKFSYEAVNIYVDALNSLNYSSNFRSYGLPVRAIFVN